MYTLDIYLLHEYNLSYCFLGREQELKLVMLPVLVAPSSLQNDFIIGLLDIQGKKTTALHSSFVHNIMETQWRQGNVSIKLYFFKEHSLAIQYS